MTYKILVAEDDEDIVELLKLYMKNEGFQVVTASNGVDALLMLKKTKVDLAVLDLMMPRMNGYELTKKIREVSNIPIIILSAKSEDSDKIIGLNIGADDYLTKPFNPLEIIARINANLRRVYSTGPQVTEKKMKMQEGELELDTASFILKKNGKEVMLTPMEYKILVFLMESPGRVYTKAQIYENINGAFFESDENTLMVHMSKLRDKIEDDSKNPRYLKTIRGVGYKFEKQ
ncbi:MAG: response regulator transcription factor [Lachnospiraceae bacterium]